MRFGGSASCVLLVALAAIGLTACSPLPYPTTVPKAVQFDLKNRAKQADQTDQTDQTRDWPAVARAISFCYSEMFNTPQELMDEARLECKNGALIYLDSDTIWTPCSLQQPVRATFLCTPNSATQSPQ